MDIEPQGDGTLHVAHAPDRFRDLEQEAAILGGKFGLPVKLLSREEVAETQYDSTEQFGALLSLTGFGLQPLGFARGLAAAAARHGAKLHGKSSTGENTHEIQSLMRTTLDVSVFERKH